MKAKVALGYVLFTMLAAIFPSGFLDSQPDAQTAEKQAVEKRPSERLTVSRGEFRSQMLLTGELKAEDAVLLIAPNANIWPLPVRWVEEDGVEVARGDVVVEFDNTQLVSNMEQLETRLLEAENELLSERARVASEVAEARFELERKKAEVAKARLDAEVPARLLSDRDHETRQLALKKAELELSGAERKLENARQAGSTDIELKRINLEKARNEVTKAIASIEKLTLKAARDGILLISENRQEGRPVRPGDTVHPGMVVAQIPDLETLQVEAQLFDVDDERVRPGQLVQAWLDAFPDREYKGRVREVDEMANEAGRFSLRRFFTVRITLDEVDAELMRPGMSVKVIIEKPPMADVLLVPRSSLDWTGENPRVMLGSGETRDVELGPCNARHCVVEAGLAEGDSLARVSEVLG